jgi:hypothetical protein
MLLTKCVCVHTYATEKLDRSNRHLIGLRNLDLWLSVLRSIPLTSI